jgi:hypothetical protein
MDRSFERRPLPVLSHRFLLITAVVSAFAYWLTYPSAGRIDGHSCEPTNVFASLSEWFYQDDFWHAQIETARSAKLSATRAIESVDEMRRLQERTSQQARDAIDRIYAENPRMAPSGASRTADVLRRRADGIENAESDNNLKMFYRGRLQSADECLNAIFERLKPRR